MTKPKATAGAKPGPRPKALPPLPPARPTITQAELVEYRRLKGQLKELEADVTAKRRSLIQRVKKHAHVEPGLWIPGVIPRESRHFTAEIVAQAIGMDAMEAIRASIPPIIVEEFGLTSEEPT